MRTYFILILLTIGLQSCLEEAFEKKEYKAVLKKDNPREEAHGSATAEEAVEYYEETPQDGPQKTEEVEEEED
jgi:hypothetical protein